MNRKTIQAGILTIGDELLIGQVIDTNSAWIAQQLNSIGIWVKQRVSVGDDAVDMRNALDILAGECSVVIITGGLGPTADDITKPTLAAYFGCSTFIRHQPTLDHIAAIFRKLNRPFTERNQKQADIPECCTVISNPNGTAPGMMFTKDETIFISLPGVPFEMKAMITGSVLTMLQQRFDLPFITHRTLLTSGIGESNLADIVEAWSLALPSNFKLAYLPNYGMVRLRLTASGNEEIVLHEQADKYFVELKTMVREWLVTDQDEGIEQTLTRILEQRNLTLATAESCTGGNIARLLTQHAGASKTFEAGIVSYSYAVKHKILDVSNTTLETEGAVSESVVQQMVKGCLQATGADVAIAVSGIMGPGGGTETKPVGSVWIAVGNGQGIVSKLFKFRFDRQRNIDLTSVAALDMMRRFVLEHYSVSNH